ncbi:MAG TPA: hypothetical protein VLB49_02175 [Gemmatimonadales bacterium]|nr:hypothetical protein [Gemmatimonadales bacterium]
MAERRPFLLRIDSGLYDTLQRWAGDELRSLNGQIEFLLRRAAVEAGRLRGERTQDEEHRKT